MTNDELNAIKARAAAAQLGPWRWEMSPKSKTVGLYAPGRSGSIVTDFVRWGMSGAKPRFQNVEAGIMFDAERFAKVVPGREHHASWFQTLDHPDANFIAASRADVDALLAHIAELEERLIIGTRRLG